MKNYLINYKKNIRDSLIQLEENDQKCLIVTDSNKKVVGTLTDGDIRRALLRRNNLETKILNFVKKKPLCVKLRSSLIDETEIKRKIKDLLMIVKDDNIDVIPVINHKNQILKILFTKDFKKILKKNNNLSNVPVLIMAGGRGSRLKQFTNYFPKPLVPVEDVTAVEHIINNFSKFGSKNFYMSVFYKKNLIKSYLKENNIKNIKFLEEKEPLGTAGSLGLIKNRIKNDFFLINCDSILSINYEKFYEFHKKNNFNITLVAASKNFKISYGACEINKKNGQLIKIKEKPNLNYLVSVGLYLIKPKVLRSIRSKKPLEMDQLITKIKNQGGRIGVFPISENNWLDTGQIGNLK